MNAFQHAKPAVSAVALATALLAGQAAWADVTAQQVWDDWKAQMALGEEAAVTFGAETYENGVLTVSDLALDLTGEDGSTVTGDLGDLVFTENGDGTVTITTPEQVPITITSPANAETGSPATEVALAVRQSGTETTVSGDPGALVYDISAARYAIELESVTEDGVEQPAEALLALNDLSGTYTSTTGETRNVAYDLAAASMDLLLDVTNPEDGSQVMVSGKVEDIAGQAEATLPLDPATPPEAMMMNGLAVSGGYTTGAGSYLFEVADAAGPTSGTFSTQGSELSFEIGRDAIAYDASTTGVALEATSAALPIPISASIAEYGVNLRLPLSRTEAPAPWAFGINVTDLDLNDEIWALFDPQGMLPRDPATVAVGLSGTATLFQDVMDPAAQEAMATAGTPPGEVNSVSIDDLDISFGGAQVTGTGSFTLDNADMTTFPGMPRPEGSAEFQLNGVNGLIDNLAAMGLIPQDQVMGARMMLGMFATATGEDQLTSRVEVNAEGHLLVNGQRLQ